MTTTRDRQHIIRALQRYPYPWTNGKPVLPARVEWDDAAHTYRIEVKGETRALADWMTRIHPAIQTRHLVARLVIRVAQLDMKSSLANGATVLFGDLFETIIEAHKYRLELKEKHAAMPEGAERDAVRDDFNDLHRLINTAYGVHVRLEDLSDVPVKPPARIHRTTLLNMLDGDPMTRRLVVTDTPFVAPSSDTLFVPFCTLDAARIVGLAARYNVDEVYIEAPDPRADGIVDGVNWLRHQGITVFLLDEKGA